MQIVLYISYSLNMLEFWIQIEKTVNIPLLSRASRLSLFTEQFQTERVVTKADAFDKLLSHN